jgi:2-phospho-L-lactate/phosphoenolpyruvate guanylyltransferase
LDGHVSMWAVILPVKNPPQAKSRLSSLPASVRVELAQAFFADVLTAAVHTPQVGQIIVVGDVCAEITHPKVAYTADPSAGLNAALIHASTLLAPNTYTMALMADLPAISPADISAALLEAEKFERSFICDAEGIGTTALMAHRPADLDPRFGPRSRAAHAASGAVELQVADLGRMHRDVDTEVGLWDAERLGVGQHTHAVLTRNQGNSPWLGATCVEWSDTARRRIVLDDGLTLAVDPAASLTGFLHLRTGQRVEVALSAAQDLVTDVRWPALDESKG